MRVGGRWQIETRGGGQITELFFVVTRFRRGVGEVEIRVLTQSGPLSLHLFLSNVEIRSNASEGILPYQVHGHPSDHLIIVIGYLEDVHPWL